MKSDPFERPYFVGAPLGGTDPSDEAPHPTHVDAALERWWAELPRGRRRQALLLAADDTVPEDLVVTLLLYGILTADDLRPLGRVPQPPEVRRLIVRELLRAAEARTGTDGFGTHPCEAGRRDSGPWCDGRAGSLVSEPPDEVRTERLVLTRPVPADADDVFGLYSDRRVWKHFPSRRHTHRGTTEELLAHVEESWQVIGLGSWVARDGEGRLVGTGGCDLRLGLAWNLGYRLARDAWGKGFAQEIIRAAVVAAHQVRPDMAITAYLLEHNSRSRAAAERAGLELVWTGPDAGNPDRDAVRLLYADRPLSRIVLRELTAS